MREFQRLKSAAEEISSKINIHPSHTAGPNIAGAYPAHVALLDHLRIIVKDSHMTLDELVSEMNDRADKLKDLGHTVLFDLGDDGKVMLDATGDEVVITPNPDDDDAETTLTLSTDNMVKLINGDLNPMVAFTMGKLKVFGSKGIALKLSSLLEN